ncbi:MAG: CopD family protein [Betaproteobacteria bacterium]
MQIARWIHLLGVVVWVGGMFFAHMALRPAVQTLPPPQRLALLTATLTHFLRWVAVAIVAILSSGIALIVMLGGMREVSHAVHVMVGLGLLMMLIFAHIAAAPFRRLRAAVAAGEWERAGAAMALVRKLVAINLVLGLLTITVAVVGH